MCSRASAGSLPGSFATTLRLCSGSIRVRAASASVPGKAKPCRVPACASRNSSAALWPLPSKMRSAALALTVAITRSEGNVSMPLPSALRRRMPGRCQLSALRAHGSCTSSATVLTNTAPIAPRSASARSFSLVAAMHARGDPRRSASARRRTAPRSGRAGRARRNRRSAVPAPTRRGRRTPPAPRPRRRRRCSSGPGRNCSRTRSSLRLPSRTIANRAPSSPRVARSNGTDWNQPPRSPAGCRPIAAKRLAT